MAERLFLRSVKLSELLSYGPETDATELKALNVIIGPNGAGKSNLMEAMAILQAAPNSLPKPLREGGGTAEWLWKGEQGRGFAEIEVLVDYPRATIPLRYRLSFGLAGQKFELVDEAIENSEKNYEAQDEVRFYYRYQQGQPVIAMKTPEDDEEDRGMVPYQRALPKGSVSAVQSILAQKRDAEEYPELTWLAEQLDGIRIFRDWSFGRESALRKPQQVDQPEDFLADDASNLALVLNDLLHRGKRKQIVELLGKFYDGIEDITTKVQGGTIQVYLHESEMKQPIPASRLSDGTLRYLCLIAVLCHPEPPSLVCIDEPELGIHPDILPTIGEMLIKASERCQLVVTTHSDALVSALSETPESVLVCEKMGGSSHLTRLEPAVLEAWLKEYSLGDIWRMGEIGGNRW